MDKHLILIAGPTASGKTALAVRLAQELGTEIISADARQVYREMRIGTAMPSAEELAAIPHHLVGHRSVNEPYDASDYAREAEEIATTLFRKHDQIILCGGSGLYIKAYLEGLDIIPDVPEEVRKKISGEYAQMGMDWLRNEISQVDPLWFRSADTSNPRRLLRALEVYRASGKPLSSFQSGIKRSHSFGIIKVGLDLPREILGSRIDRRVDAMVEKGLFTEAESLYPFRDLPALQTVGYREIFSYIEGQWDREEALSQIRLHTRQYAKRQVTWFRKDADISWFNPTRPDEILLHIRQKFG